MPPADSPVAFRGKVLPLSTPAAADRQVVVSRDGVIALVADRIPAPFEEVRTLDFGDRPILPGFIDPHAHVEIACTAAATTADCRAPHHASVADVLDELAAAERQLPSGDWLVGQANLFFDQKVRDRRLPTRAELDTISRRRPIAIRAGGHRTVLNSKALDVTGVARYLGKQGGMGGAVVELDESGQPSGVIAELDHVLGISGPSREDLRTFLHDGIRDIFLAHGVTTIGEMSQTQDGLACFADLAQAGQLPVRVVAYVWSPGTMPQAQALAWGEQFRADQPSGDFAVRGMKMFADGGYSSFNAATRTPYASPPALRRGSRGKLNLTPRQVVSAVTAARKAGLQLAIHANGERAQDAVCAGVLKAGGSGPFPVRLEHAGNVTTTSATTKAWRAAGAIPVSEPVFIYNFGDFLPVYLGPAIEPGLFPFRDLLAEGWDLSGSSDVHLGAEPEQTNPLFGIWCCVSRRSFLGEVINESQAVSVDDALRMHTINAAKALSEDVTRGSLETGKVSDLVVLEKDPRAVPVDDLRTLKVDYVFRSGRLAYSRPGARPWLEQQAAQPAAVSGRQ